MGGGSVTSTPVERPKPSSSSMTPKPAVLPSKTPNIPAVGDGSSNGRESLTQPESRLHINQAPAEESVWLKQPYGWIEKLSHKSFWSDPSFYKSVSYAIKNTRQDTQFFLYVDESGMWQTTSVKNSKIIPFKLILSAGYLHESEMRGNSSGKPQDRKIPPLSERDTVQYITKDHYDLNLLTLAIKLNIVQTGFFEGSYLMSDHGVTHFFQEEDIIEKLDVIKEVSIGRTKDREVFASYTSHNKAIIQQQATRGCTAAAAAMLILDHGKVVDMNELYTRNLGKNDDEENDIKKAGLVPIMNKVSDMTTLRQALINHGSAIVTIDFDGAHVIVVDDISEDLTRVRLRDPYHGWEITVKSSAFVPICKFGNIIQVKAS